MGLKTQVWEVVGGANTGGILVRQGQATTSAAFERRLATGARVKGIQLINDRLHYEKISGDGPEVGWVTVKLANKELVVRLSDAEARGSVREKLPENCEVPAVFVSSMLEELERELSLAGAQAPSAPRPLLPPLALRSAAAAAETAASGSRGQEEGTMSINFPEGLQEGAGTVSQEVRAWLDMAKAWLDRLQPSAKVPASVRMPTSALGWEPPAAVLFALTHGQFDPQRDLPGQGAQQRALQQSGLVSMVCATSDGRRSFHPLVYENFRTQTYEQRELVVVHTGEMPSDFFREVAAEDPRVVYRFFPVTREAPGSPRLTDEQQANPWAAVLKDDAVEEVAQFQKAGPDPSRYDDVELKALVEERGVVVPQDAPRIVLEEIVRSWGDPGKTKLYREGWTKGLKRNIGICIARGAIIAHCDDGCLYAPDYLSRMRTELIKKAGSEDAQAPAAVALSKWYTLAISEQDFRQVDLRFTEAYWDDYPRVDKNYEREQDQWNHGFAFMYTRVAWHQQPFPDIETVATSDGNFMRALEKLRLPVSLVTPPTAEGLAACGWHREATAGAVDVIASVNTSLYLNYFRFRGQDVDGRPKAFKGLIKSVKEVASQLLHRRERYLQDLVEEHGSVHVCSNCNFAVAMARNLQETKEVSVAKYVFDAVDVATTFMKEKMKFEAAYFTAAGGAVAEGDFDRAQHHPTLNGMIQRHCICRNCGWQLGWRYEPAANAQTWEVFEKARRNWEHPSMAEAEPLRGPVSWSLIWRHLRERKKAGEHVPEDDTGRGASRHAETQHNRSRSDVCPAGHKLRCFGTGQGNGGALPLMYTCDVCDRDARWNEHYYGCGTCDYDICETCRAGRGDRYQTIGYQR